MSTSGPSGPLVFLAYHFYATKLYFSIKIHAAMNLLLYFINFLKNDVEFVDDFSDCKEVFYFESFIQVQFSFAFAFDGITFLKPDRIIPNTDGTNR